MNPVFKIILYSGLLLLAFWACSGSFAEEENTIFLELLSKRKIQYLCVNSNSKTKKNQIKLNKKEKWCFQPKNKHLQLFSRVLNENINLPEKITLLPESKEGICLDTKDTHGRCYKGSVTIKNKEGHLNIINEVSVIDYLNSVAGSEIPPDWPTEAVKAQTVAIHSYLLNALESNKTLKDTTQDQFYGGSTYENSSYREYTNQVMNVIMVDSENKPVKALYHSTCAGKTLNNEDVFGGKPLNYLRSTPCKYDSESNFARTKTYEIKLDKLKNLLRTTSILFKKKSDGSLLSVQLDHSTLSPYEFWLQLGQKLGWGAVPGIKYNINCNKGLCVINSKGAGHAVGLCQWGARGMAKKGFNYQDILRYYYKNIFFKEIPFSKRVQK